MPAPVLRVVNTQTFRVRRTLNFDDIRWASVLQLLVKRHHLDFRSADATLKSFFRRVLTPFHPRWFLAPELTEKENSLVLSICESHGADSITILRKITYLRPPATISYRLELDLEPDFRIGMQNESRATVRPLVYISFRGRTVQLSSGLSILCINVLIGGLLVLSYAVVFGAFLYVLAVFAVFLREPTATTVVATRSFPIGLAFLSGLVVVGALTGKLVRRVIGVGRLLARQTSVLLPIENGTEQKGK